MDGAGQRDPNTFFGNESQRPYPPSFCELKEFHCTSETALISADATRAYSDQLAKFKRHVFFLSSEDRHHPDLIAILDDVQAKDSIIKRDFALHFHTPYDAEILDEGTSAVIRGSKWNLLLFTLASSDCLLSISQPTPVGKVCLRRLTVKAYWVIRHPEDTSKLRFLTLLLPFSKDVSRPVVTQIKNPSLLGLQVQQGEKLQTLLCAPPDSSDKNRRLEAFGIVTDAQACLVAQEEGLVKNLIVLWGKHVAVENRRIFSSKRITNLCMEDWI